MYFQVFFLSVRKKETPKDEQGRGWGHDKKASGDPPPRENWRDNQNGNGKGGGGWNNNAGKGNSWWGGWKDQNWNNDWNWNQNGQKGGGWNQNGQKGGGG